MAKKPQTQAAPPAAPEGRPVVITTNHKGVFFGYATSTVGDIIALKRARNAYYWAGGGGILQLGATGPAPGSKIGDRADVELRGISGVIECTPEAVKAWEAATWSR